MEKIFFAIFPAFTFSILFAPTPQISHNDVLALRLHQRIEHNRTLQLQLRDREKKLSETARTYRREFNEIDIDTEREFLHTLSHQVALHQQEHSLKNKLPFSRTTLASKASNSMRARSRSQ